MTVLVACGAICWWANRLSPDEQIFVGRWKAHLRTSGNTPTPIEFHEFHSNRTAYSNSGRFQWAVSEGQLKIRQFRPYHQILLENMAILPGSGDYETCYIGRYEIIDQDKIIMTSPVGSFVVDYVWTRIVEH